MDFKLFLVVFLLQHCRINASPVSVHLPIDVKVTGESIRESSTGRLLNQFLGIPYAQPPIESLRFRKPLPWQPKEGQVREIVATKWASRCFQVAIPFLEGKPDPYLQDNSPQFSEDCLYLNVWTPVVTANTKLRPVLVWIHGGGLIYGSSSFELYNGETLASKADAVIVSINYRLSTLGFLYSDQVADVPGNQGLWDQALALQWVQDNIRAFGGDPEQVTIVGESGGSWSVSAHILSPISRNLFANAILMSGAIPKINEPELNIKPLLGGLRKVGCATEEDTSIDAKVISCLEKMDATKLSSLLVESIGIDGISYLVKDGEFFPDTPRALLSAGNYRKSFNLLLSTVEDETPSLNFFFPNDTRFRMENPTAITLDESKQIFVSTFKKGSTLQIESALKVYATGLSGHIENSDANRRIISRAVGDSFLGCPTINFAKALFKSNPEINVYQWFYTAKVGNPGKWMCSAEVGACHTDDIFPLFGVPFRYPSLFHNRERDISNEVINFVSEFIRSGTPGPYQKEWEPYFLVGNSTVVAPYYRLGNDYKSPASFGFNLKQLECETIWKDMA